MEDYLPKPLDCDLLFRKVSEWTGKRRSAPADPEALLRSLGGDKAALEAVLRQFREEAPRQFQELRAAAEAGDSATTEKAAHRLRGSLLAVNATEGVCLVEGVESRARERDLSTAMPLVPRLEAELSRILEHLAQVPDGEQDRGRPAPGAYAL